MTVGRRRAGNGAVWARRRTPRQRRRGGAAEHVGEEELVVELALAMLGGRGRVHELHAHGGSC